MTDKPKTCDRCGKENEELVDLDYPSHNVEHPKLCCECMEKMK